MDYRTLLLPTLLLLAACASTPASHPADGTPLASETTPAPCPAIPDTQQLLARHAGSFGSQEAVKGALPRSFTGKSAGQGKSGSVELVLDRNGKFSQSVVVDGMLSANGIDGEGPWSLGYAGVPLRLREDEALDLDFHAWLQGRDYLASFDPNRDSATCTIGAAGPQLSLRYQLPGIGNPELTFALGDAALLSAAHLDINGHRSLRNFETWSDVDQNGVRWPLTIRQREASGSESLLSLGTTVPGIACPSRASQECLAPPHSRLSFSWPAETPVRVPSSFFMNEVLLHAKVAGRSFWGLVDSGAGVTAVDAGSPLASVFRPAASKESLAPDQRIPFSYGAIGEAVQLGGLTVGQLPAALIPMPSFDVFGERRPEALIGYPIFLSTAVRIDFARQEFLLAREAGTLHSASATPIPVKLLGQSLVVEAKIDGVSGWFVLDTGDSEALDLFRDWAGAHGFPGARPSYTMRQQSEIGDHQADEKRMRPATFELGPIHISEPLVAIDSVNSPSNRIAGQIGNGVFARCAAVVFDIGNRTLWLDPPCNRDLPEDLSGWVLEKKENAAYPDRPWVVRFVLSGGSADLAGVKAGDRILQIGGLPAVLDIGSFESVTKQVATTKVPVVIVRGAATKEVTLNLVRLLSP